MNRCIIKTDKKIKMKQAVHAKKVSKNSWGQVGSKDVQKVSSFLNDLQKPLDVFSYFFLSTPPHTQVKNVTMSRNAAEGNVAPRVSKIVLLRHLRPKLLEINSASLNPPAKKHSKITSQAQKSSQKICRDTILWEKTLWMAAKNPK